MQGYLEGENIEISQVPLETCKTNCDSNTECKGFQFTDEMDSECMLLKKDKPNGPRRNNFKFCKKLGIIIFNLDFQLNYFVLC